MFRKKSKLGFTLIEMLIVIAIIAALVAVVMPVIGRSTTKSAAATNAANLRAIKGQLSKMRVMYPDDFKTMMSEQGVVGSAITGIWGGILDAWFGDGVGDQTITGLMCSFTADDGVLTLYAPNIVIKNVPTSKKMSTKGSNKSNRVTLEEGVQMSVLITETDIIPSYGGYTIEQFADIAEDGKLDEHTIAAPSGGGGIAGGYCEIVKHHTDENGDEICDICSYAMGWHDCADAAGDGDHQCDSANCLNQVTSCADKTGDNDHKCDECGKNNITSHTDASNDGNHTCDECAKTGVTSCTDSNGDKKCDDCGKCLCKVGKTNWILFVPSAGECSECSHKHFEGVECGK